MVFGRKRARSRGTTIFFATDLHGSTTCFRKFLNAPAYYEQQGYPIDALVLGGDLTGKLIVPVIRQNGGYRAYLLGKQHELGTDEELAGLVKQCETMGVYPHVFEPDDYEEFSGDETRQDELFRDLMMERLRGWIELAEERLADRDLFCSMMPGNDDIDDVDRFLDASDRIVNSDRKAVRIDDRHEMVSLGVANETPFDCPRDVPEDVITKEIDSLAQMVEDVDRAIFNIHVPPYQTGIDEAPQLDDQLRPKVGAQGVEMEPVGSVAVRTSLLKHQPMLALHGHIHESRGTAQLGRTMCLNPGSEYSEGILRGAIITVADGEVASHMLISG